ncbi:hypothetical protein PoB_005380500 [Plakobranchus ocellatus]|uniref:Uncharacterized protein n=1 Tax=Plakobranchus ocellatus TaxID=259542 RepID=A0AAV4C797_9GAST|nr:hypothetical protein PoB_005380500 [Plakobranchus ocellatus]
MLVKYRFQGRDSFTVICFSQVIACFCGTSNQSGATFLIAGAFSDLACRNKSPSGAQTRDKRMPADSRADSLAAVPPTPPITFQIRLTEHSSLSV